ncbi:Peroxisomal membrane protein Pex17 [Teratosphaeria destructans]|uniref:Peroxisomal membrane protein Pex17 n=1 Tax=Teratosphaeria destructans TaxID=418781 RepID=A0A9W7SSF2_9PEZI|nr:Peroxisomal membrane protein Pex17 [Teratosphaeria destructans]
MPADRLLGTLLRSLQTYTDQQDTPRLLGTASSLLTTLNNPLNVTLLTTQLLIAPAIWGRPEGLRTCMRCLSVFHSAAQALVRHENTLRDKHASPDQDFAALQLERALPRDDWIRAVVSGCDDHAPRWRHLLVIGGLLLGFGQSEDEHLSRSMRSTLEEGLVMATNASLDEMLDGDELGRQTIAVVLNHCFVILSDHERAGLDYSRLLPVLMRSVLHSSEGLRSAYFLGAIDVDMKLVTETHFKWSEQSTSYHQIQAILSSPLSSSLGPLARLVSHAVEQVGESRLVMSTLIDIEDFARTLYLQWRQLKLSEIDASEENIYLDHETLEKTTPQLWKLLRSSLYAITIIMRSVLGRMLGDAVLAADTVAPRMATQALNTLRYLYFISTRLGSSTFSQYTFTYLTAMDILASYPLEADAFLRDIRPAELGHVPRHPIERTLDLFFLNTAEHFTLCLSGQTCEDLLIAAATPYLAAGRNNSLLPIFEAAHSVMLATFSAPQNAELTTKHLPFYVDALFKVFPSNLSSRQFRLAFKTLLRLASPPSVLAVSQPLLAATLLELLHAQASGAGTIPLFPHSGSNVSTEDVAELSEQAVLTLTLLDTLTELPLDLLDEWLPIAADMVDAIQDAMMKEHCKEHFWHILVDGEMDPDRSQLCAAWWNTGGGREHLLFGSQDRSQADATVMSGALPARGVNKL